MPALYKLRRLTRNTLLSARDCVKGDHRQAAFRAAMKTIPLMLADKTYNTAHHDYNPALAGNFPGRIEGADLPCNNPLFTEIKKLSTGGRVGRLRWRPVLAAAMREAKTVPGFDQVMERKAFIEQYLGQLAKENEAHYAAGWVNMTDAKFLYWMVRKFKPKVIVQTGVSNGLSSAFMMLALAKNGPDGKLYAIDIPAIYDPKNPDWKQKGTVYGVAIPEGKSSGWMVPDIYKDRAEMLIGDAKELMPKLVDRLDHIDMFYHDSDHSYAHMMFEYEQAMRKLTPGGLIVADDVSWNASLWDFAKARKVPAYNFRGTVGLAFFSGQPVKT